MKPEAKDSILQGIQRLFRERMCAKNKSRRKGRQIVNNKQSREEKRRIESGSKTFENLIPFSLCSSKIVSFLSY